jgi:hypothetical protein
LLLKLNEENKEESKAILCSFYLFSDVILISNHDDTKEEDDNSLIHDQFKDYKNNEESNIKKIYLLIFSEFKHTKGEKMIYFNSILNENKNEENDIYFGKNNYTLECATPVLAEDLFKELENAKNNEILKLMIKFSNNNENIYKNIINFNNEIKENEINEIKENETNEKKEDNKKENNVENNGNINCENFKNYLYKLKDEKYKNIDLLKKKIESFNPILNNFSDNQKKIKDKNEELRLIENYLTKFQEFEKKYFELLKTFNNLIETLKNESKEIYEILNNFNNHDGLLVEFFRNDNILFNYFFTPINNITEKNLDDFNLFSNIDKIDTNIDVFKNLNLLKNNFTSIKPNNVDSNRNSNNDFNNKNNDKKKGRIIRDFISKEKNDFNCFENDIVNITKPDNDGLTECELNNKTGIIPTEYIEIINNENILYNIINSKNNMLTKKENEIEKLKKLLKDNNIKIN